MQVSCSGTYADVVIDTPSLPRFRTLSARLLYGREQPLAVQFDEVSVMQPLKLEEDHLPIILVGTAGKSELYPLSTALGANRLTYLLPLPQLTSPTAACLVKPDFRRLLQQGTTFA